MRHNEFMHAFSNGACCAHNPVVAMTPTEIVTAAENILRDAWQSLESQVDWEVIG